MYTVELRSSHDAPFQPLRCHPASAPGEGPWQLLSPELRDDIEAWDAMLQASWNEEKGWVAWSQIGVVYRRVGPRLRQRLREELDPQLYRVIDTKDP